jgi:DNA mismatch repair protein MutS
MRKEKSLTPGMKQYWEIKNKYKDCIVLFRMGDFYETFYDDAKVVARDLKIVLTSRGKEDKKAPLAGLPYHALDNHLKKLIDKGHKVVIVEQLEDPKKAKGLVKRGVVRIVTPGTVIEPSLITNSNNYLVSIYPEKEKIGICACDISTGEMECTEVGIEEIETEIEKYKPKEVLFPEEISFDIENKIDRTINKNKIENYKFDETNGEFLLSKILGTKSFTSYGLHDKKLAKKALSGILSYLDYTQMGNELKHIHKISYYNNSKNMIIDASTIKNLDLIENQFDGSLNGTLFEVLNQTITPMGERMLKKWILSPLIDKNKIEERLDCVHMLYGNPILLEEIRNELEKIGDLERIATRISYKTALPRDLLMLEQSLKTIEKLTEIVSKNELKGIFYNEFKNMNTLKNVQETIQGSINENSKQTLREGGIIKENYSEELDKLREIMHNSEKWIRNFEKNEREKTGIKNLKVKYNKIIGYYIEISKGQLSKVPENYIRKQSQVNSERFISSELKETEIMVLNASERIIELEYELYMKILEHISNFIKQIYEISSLTAELDLYSCFSKISYENRYVKPLFCDEDLIEIKQGRHPVVEKSVIEFIPNDIYINENGRIFIITGPNMAGKSTIMRQVALITIMAQMGCFIPADECKMGICDKVFTRVGARDDITRGQSTFMMEMVETANILNNATSKSLVIFDEIGRGTSTYDGMAIAWAIVEHLAEKTNSKTLFATHYHLLNLLSLKYPSKVKNYNVTVIETEKDVVFMHKLVEGGTDKSYGVHVAHLAGVPPNVVENAKTISKLLEENDLVHRQTLNKLTRNNKKTDKNQTNIDIWTV